MRVVTARPTPDVAVVGGGLVGCAAARAAAARGLRVVLLERNGALGREASTAAAGMLAPQMEEAAAIVMGHPAEPDAAMIELSRASLQRYPELVRELEASTGHEVPYEVEGTLVVALDAAGADGLEATARSQRERGMRATWVPGIDARRLEPTLSADVTGALMLPDDHRVDTGALVDAIATDVTAAEAIDVRLDSSVRGLVVEGGRVVGVTTEAGRLDAGAVVVAAGAWSARLEGLPRAIPVRPVKGQMGSVATKTSLVRTVFGPGAYCVPRGDGRILVGATMEDAGFDDTVDAEVVDGLRETAARFLTALADEPLEETWAGLRPATPDDRPILGPDPDVDGLVWATGHHRNGILLAPVTAEAVADVLTGATPPVDLAPFAADRAFPTGS